MVDRSWFIWMVAGGDGLMVTRVDPMSSPLHHLWVPAHRHQGDQIIPLLEGAAGHVPDPFLQNQSLLVGRIGMSS